MQDYWPQHLWNIVGCTSTATTTAVAQMKIFGHGTYVMSSAAARIIYETTMATARMQFFGQGIEVTLLAAAQFI